MEGLHYKCPQCGAALKFHSQHQHWGCDFCHGEFALDELEVKPVTVRPPEPSVAGEAFDEGARGYSCPSCGAHIVTDATTAATFCMFCGNPTVIPERLSDRLRPARLIPFQKSKEEAKAAFAKLCRGKPFLPKGYADEAQKEKITGVYVPFWLYDCLSDGELVAEGVRVTTWSDKNYRYTKSDFYSIELRGGAAFGRVPVDGSRKMDDALMDSIEPFDFSALTPFAMPYLSGYFAETYDLDAAAVFPRARDRVGQSTQALLHGTISGYGSVRTQHQSTTVTPTKTEYVLLPVWFLHTKYQDKPYVFAMNGQTGKVMGNLPISQGRVWAWFGGLFGAITLAIWLIGGLL